VLSLLAAPVENYFNYFTEIEHRFQQRRGSIHLLSTLDWALIETWKDAGVSLEAVLRGIDAAFDKYDRKPPRAKSRKVNSLAYCSQEVLSAAQDIAEASTGAHNEVSAKKSGADAGFSPQEITAYLRKNADLLRRSSPPEAARPLLQESAASLERLAEAPPPLEDLERHLTVLEEKIFATLLSNVPDDDLLRVRAEADRDIAPYRSKMQSAQMDQLHRQYVNKRLLEQAKVPRLSLFYL